MILLTSHDFVIVIVFVIVLSLEPKTTTTPRTQNKRSADQLIALACMHCWRW
jgi:hypothetical protein